MFSNVYIGGKAKEEEGKAQQMLELLFHYYMDHPDRLTPEYIRLMERGESRERVVCDYISGMTDNYAIEKFEELFVPIGWKF
jgi:dGTPase